MRTSPRLGLQIPDEPDLVTNYPADAAQSLGILDSAAIELQDVLVNRPAAGTLGRYFWATDGAALYRDNGTNWIQIYPQVHSIGRAFTVDDTTTPNAFASIIGSFFIRLAPGVESATMTGAYIHTVTVGGTASVFAVQYDHGAHGTLSTVPGLGALTPGTTQAFVPVTGTITVSEGDRIALHIVTVGSSVGYTIEPIIQQTP